MSVNVTVASQEEELSKLESEAVKQLETETASSTTPEGDKPEGETATPEPGSTPGDQTTTTPEDGGTKPEPGDNPSGTVPENDPKKPADGKVEDKGQPSDRAQSRQQKLANELRDARLAQEALRRENEQLRQGRTPPATPTTKLPWNEEDGTVTMEQYTKDVEAKADQIVERKFEIKELETNLHNDIAEMEGKYPELSQGSDEYDQDLVDFISDNFKARIKENPKLRLKDYTAKIMELRGKAAESAKTAANNNIRRNIGTQPIISGAKTTKETTVEDELAGAKTIAELDAIAERNLPKV